MKTYLWFIALLCAGFYSCESKPSPIPTSQHFITSYQDAAAIYVAASEEKLTDPKTQETRLLTKIEARPYENKTDSRTKDLVDKKRFEELAKQFRDVDYNRSETLGIPAMYIQTDRLDIVSDSYYDAAHPAGASLSDLVQLYYFCCDNILKNPYDFNLSEQQKASGCSVAYEFKEPLAEFNQKKPTLVAFDFWLWLQVKPEIAGTHRFTVTYKNVAGKVLSATSNPIDLAGR